MLGRKLKQDEDIHHEFKMHLKNTINEVPKKSQKTVNGRIIRCMQPNSKSICGFLNSDGGRIYIGVDDSGKVKGVELTSFELDHFILSLHHCLQKFNPPVPIDLVKMKISKISHNNRDENQWIDLNELCEMTGVQEHLIGGFFCPCRRSNFEKMKYLIIIEISPSSDDTIYQNEEGLVYYRRNGCNRMLTIDQLRQYKTQRIICNEISLPVYNKVRTSLTMSSTVCSSLKYFLNFAY